MADAAASDVTSGVNYQMKHRSVQLTFQNCQTCHTAALGEGATQPSTAALWQTGAYHPSLGAQPSACVDCHTVSRPAANVSTQSALVYSLSLGGTATNGAQWMNHGASTVVRPRLRGVSRGGREDRRQRVETRTIASTPRSRR